MTPGRAAILVVDNHDSFVHTLVGYLHELGVDTDLVEADEIDAMSAASVIDPYRGVVVSPGPGTPSRAGASIAVVHAAAATGMPLLGVCLGHQAIGEAFGATIGQAPELMHGLTSQVRHDGSALYAGLTNPFTATRYHSLTILPETLPAALLVTSITDGGVIMGVQHRTAPIWGVQFHPESILTEGGHRLLGNWLELAGMTDAAARGSELSPRRDPLTSSGLGAGGGQGPLQ